MSYESLFNISKYLILLNKPWIHYKNCLKLKGHTQHSPNRSKDRSIKYIFHFSYNDKTFKEQRQRNRLIKSIKNISSFHTTINLHRKHTHKTQEYRAIITKLYLKLASKEEPCCTPRTVAVRKREFGRLLTLGF